MRRITLPALTACALLLVACGGSTDASNPPILSIANSADQPRGALEASGSGDKMMWMGGMHFTASVDLPSLDSDAASYVISASSVSKRDLSSLREVFALKDEFVVQGADVGGGYLAGDYSTGDSPTMSVSADAMHYWSYQAPWSRSMTDVGCEVAPVASGDAVSSVEPCAAPTPPKNVPSAAQAEDLFFQMLKDLGLKSKDFITESYADEWNANVTGYLMIDGVRTSLSWSASYGADAELVWASGVLAEVTQAADYPRIGTAQGVERLNNEYGWDGPTVRGGVADEDMSVESPSSAGTVGLGTEPVFDEGVEATVATEPVIPDAVILNPPDDQEMPVTEIEITAVEEELVSLYGSDGSIYLVPGYAFLPATAPGQAVRYIVSALPDEFTDEANDDSDQTPDTGVSEVPTPETIVPEPFDPSTSAAAGAAITQAAADTLLAMSEGTSETTAANNGWEVRIGQRDDMVYAQTKDYRPDRVTLTIVSGKVTKVDVG